MLVPFYLHIRSVNFSALCWFRVEAWAWRTSYLTGWGFDHKNHIWLEEAEHISSLWSKGVCSDVSNSSAEWQLQCKLQTALPKLWVPVWAKHHSVYFFWLFKTVCKVKLWLSYLDIKIFHSGNQVQVQAMEVVLS